MIKTETDAIVATSGQTKSKKSDSHKTGNHHHHHRNHHHHHHSQNKDLDPSFFSVIKHRYF